MMSKKTSKNREFIPRTVIWDISAKCNSRCVYCYDGTDEKLYDEMSVAEIRKHVIPQFKECGVKTICFAGGEPTLRFDDIIELSRDVIDAGIVEVLLATNGTIITADHVKRFNDAFRGIDRFISIPLDSLDNVKMKELRPPFSDGVDRSLRTLKLAKQNRMIITLETVVTKKNFDEYPDILNFIKKQGSYCFAETYPCFKEGRGKENVSLLLDAEQMATLDTIKMENYGKCVTWDFMPFPVDEKTWNVIKHDAREMQITEGCVAGRDYVQLGSDGTLYPCSFLRIPLGNITKRAMKEIWETNELLVKFRNREVSGNCSSCVHKQVCGGCRARAYLETGDPLGGVPSCPVNSKISRLFSNKVMGTYRKQKLLIKLMKIAKKLRLM